MLCPLVNPLILKAMVQKETHTRIPQDKIVEIDGIFYLVIDGKLYRYADLTMDKAFKIVLGRIGSEDVLKSLLNGVLGTNIARLEYRNTEHPGMTEEERVSRFDVYCEEEDGTCFQVEMQNWQQKYFNKRAVYYSSLVTIDQANKAYAEARRRVKAGTVIWDYNFQPLYVVSFLNFKNWTSENIGDKRSEYVSIYRYKDIETQNELGDGTNLVFVDLHRFRKTFDECGSLEELWLYCIKNMFTLRSCPEKLIGTEIEELFKRSELVKLPSELRKNIEQELMTQNDILNSVAEQVEDGIREGLERELPKAVEREVSKAVETEREKQAIEIAMKMKELGVDDMVISQSTGLSLEEIAVLKG